MNGTNVDVPPTVPDWPLLRHNQHSKAVHLDGTLINLEDSFDEDEAVFKQDTSKSNVTASKGSNIGGYIKTVLQKGMPTTAVLCQSSTVKESQPSVMTWSWHDFWLT